MHRLYRHFQSISESHTLLSLYLKSAIPLCHRAVVCWLFFYYWGSCSHCENDTGLAIGRRKYPKRIGMSFSLFFICPNAERLWNIFERWHPHEQKEQPQHTPVSVSRRRPAQAETQENGAEGSKIPPQLYPHCTPSDGTAEGIAMAVASEPYAPSVLVSTEDLPEKEWLEYRQRRGRHIGDLPVCYGTGSLL